MCRSALGPAIQGSQAVLYEGLIAVDVSGLDRFVGSIEIRACEAWSVRLCIYAWAA